MENIISFEGKHSKIRNINFCVLNLRRDSSPRANFLQKFFELCKIIAFKGNFL